MTDYLFPDNIADTYATTSGLLTKQEICSAVFRLWLQPNDIRSRGVLAMYAAYRSTGGAAGGGTVRNPVKSVSALEWEQALMSRVMTRVAHGIHRYDRYAEPLLVFLVRDVINAVRDLLETKKRIREKINNNFGAFARVHANNARGVLNAWSLADLLFQDYLIKLGSDKPCGEWVDGPPRRASREQGVKKVVPAGAQIMSMTKDEIMSAVGELEAYAKNITSFMKSLNIAKPDKPKKKTVKNIAARAAYSESAGGSAKPLPGAEAFALWYDANRTGAWANKHKKMYEFIYRVKYKTKKKINWRELDKMYEGEFNEKVPVSAHSALYGGVFDEFFARLAE
jgi:hypothetical protein